MNHSLMSPFFSQRRIVSSETFKASLASEMLTNSFLLVAIKITFAYAVVTIHNSRVKFFKVVKRKKP